MEVIVWGFSTTKSTAGLFWIIQSNSSQKRTNNFLHAYLFFADLEWLRIIQVHFLFFSGIGTNFASGLEDYFYMITWV